MRQRSGQRGGRRCDRVGRQHQQGGRQQPKPELSWENIVKDEPQLLENFPFNEVEGLMCCIPENPTCLDFFELYLNNQVITLMVEETNPYADQFIMQNENRDNSYLSQWHAVTNPEMKTFLGLLLVMGIIHKPKLHLYWSTDIYYSTPIFAQITSRDRFLLLLKCLHFNNNESRDVNADPLYKVRSLLDLLCERFRKVYYPGMELSVDESLVLNKGRLKFKQYIRTKRASFGIKLYELCTSTGITLDFLVYCGKGMYDDDDPYLEMPSSERIPMVLMEPYIGKGHTLCTDNFYTTSSLGKHFLQKNTDLCGTIRNNRKKFSTEILQV